MSSVSNLNSGLPDYGGLSARTGSRQTYLNSYESMDAELTIQTKEGDVVTLSSSMFSEMKSYEYNSYAMVESDEASMQAAHHERGMVLTSGEEFRFTVEGDLSEEELKDIEAILKGIDEIIGEMADGDMEDAVAKAMTMGSYDSVAAYEADISMSQSYQVYTQTQTTAYDALGRGEENSLAGAPADSSENSVEEAAAGMTFMDKVAKLLEDQEKERLARAQQPLSQLLDHHLAALKEDAGEDEAVEEPEAEPAYAAFESFSRDVNQMVSDMIKGMFKDTLDQIV